MGFDTTSTYCAGDMLPVGTDWMSATSHNDRRYYRLYLNKKMPRTLPKWYKKKKFQLKIN
jgi:hypothetical protein